jgi:uncharacterized membrane protein
MTSYALLFTLAAIGIAETHYLIRKRRESEKPVCPIGGGCSFVLESKYNKLFGIHNDLLGLGFYLSVAALTAIVVVDEEVAQILMHAIAAMVGGALIMSAYFFYLQWRVIKHWCFWCLMSAFTVIGMSAILILSRLSYVIS